MTRNRKVALFIIIIFISLWVRILIAVPDKILTVLRGF